jgi:hypothetical protein
VNFLSVSTATAAIPGTPMRPQRFLFHFAALIGLFLAVSTRGADGPDDTGPDLFGLSV